MKKASKQDKQDKTVESEPLDKFGEMIRVMDVEHLIRFRKRLEMIGRKRMVEILTYEIKARQAQGREQFEEDLAKLDTVRALAKTHLEGT